MASVALITGATGLVGRHVLQQWTIGSVQPVAVDSAEVDLLVPGAAADLVDHLRPALVVHLAWSASGRTGYRTDPDNEKWVETSLELATACRERGVWLLATGSALDRDGAPADAYVRSKARLRTELQPYVDAGECTWLRPYYIVDPDRRRPTLIAQAFAARDAGEAISLATPDSEHDFVHAADVGSAIVTAVRGGLRGEVPIGSGELRRVSDLVAALGVAWAPAPNLVAVPPQHHAAADIGRLQDHGWSPTSTKAMFDGG